jgi:hypothetical protein
MARAYDRARTREFIPSCDRNLPPEQQTSFQLGWLSIFDFSGIADATSSAGNGFPRVLEIVRRALRGWKNFPLPDGTPAPFVTGPDGLATKETVELIGPKEIMEIARDADQSEELTAAETGKS